MLEAISNTFNRLWGSGLINRLEWAIAITVVTELLVWLITRRLRRAFAHVLQRDVHQDATERVRRRRIILGLPLLLVRSGLYLIWLVVVLRYLGFNTALELVPLLAVLLAVTAALGWRAFQDAVAGYFIAYDNLFAVGDRVSVGEFTGQVMEAGLRVTRLQTQDRRDVTVANHTIKQVVNHTRGETASRAAR